MTLSRSITLCVLLIVQIGCANTGARSSANRAKAEMERQAFSDDPYFQIGDDVTQWHRERVRRGR